MPFTWQRNPRRNPEDTEACPACDGQGSTDCPRGCHGFGTCSECQDTGRVDCVACDATGYVSAHLARRLRPRRDAPTEETSNA